MPPTTKLNLTKLLKQFILNNEFDPQKCSIEKIATQVVVFKAKNRILNHFSKAKKKINLLQIIQNLLPQDSNLTPNDIKTILLNHEFPKCPTDIRLIENACKKSTIGRSTFYDLMEIDPEFKAYCEKVGLHPQDLDIQKSKQKRLFSSTSIDATNQFEPGIEKKTKKIDQNVSKVLIEANSKDFQVRDVADIYIGHTQTRDELKISQEASPRFVKDEKVK